LVTIIAAVLIFGGIILFHEFGHFIVARVCGVTINEFSVGMGPAVWKKEKNGTLYAVRLLPIGGFVDMEGESDDDENPTTDPNAFTKKPFWQRFLILVAGSFNNVLMGYIILIVLTVLNGYVGSTRVVVFDENAVSSQYLQYDDEITAINGNRTRTAYDITYEFLRDEDGLIDVTVLRNGEKMTLPIQFAMEEQDGQQFINLDFKVAAVKPTLTEYVTYPFNWSLSIVKEIWGSFIDLVRGRYAINQLSGPVGVVSAIGAATEYGIKNLLLLAAYIAINIGVFNMLPLPILDGGRIFIELFTTVFRGKTAKKIVQIAMSISVGIVVFLMLYVTYNDIFKLIL